jgi:hypothetical protein
MKGIPFYLFSLFFFVLAILNFPHDIGVGIFFGIIAFCCGTLPMWGNF